VRRSVVVARIALVVFVLSASLVAAAQDASLGDPITLHGVEVRGWTRQHGDRTPSRTQSRHGVRIALVPGRLAGAAHGARTTVRVCGVDAIRTETETAAMPSVRVQIPNHGPSAHLVTPDRPRTTYVTIEIPRGTRWVSVEWSVPTAQRARWRALEEAFFASIRCTD
jgi:hypothetical protein